MPRLLDQVWEAIRTLPYSIRTEEAYVRWTRRFIPFHGKRHPAEMRETEVAQFLTHLAVRENVAASTQNQAPSTLLFLYEAALDRSLEWVGDVARAKEPQQLPIVLTRAEVHAVLAQGRRRSTGTSVGYSARGREGRHHVLSRRTEGRCLVAGSICALESLV